MPKLNEEAVVLIEEVQDFGLVTVKANFLDKKIHEMFKKVSLHENHLVR